MLMSIKCLTPSSIPKLEDLLILVRGLGFKPIGNLHQPAGDMCRVESKLLYGHATTTHLTVWGFNTSADIFNRNGLPLAAFQFEDDRWGMVYCDPSRWPELLSE